MSGDGRVAGREKGSGQGFEQQNPVNSSGATVIGNGTYGGDYNIVGFGISKRF